MDDEPEPPRYTPTWERLDLRCGPCGYQWWDWQPSNVPPTTWLAHMKAICRCPKCGAKRKVFMGRATPLTD